MYALPTYEYVSFFLIGWVGLDSEGNSAML